MGNSIDELASYMQPVALQLLEDCEAAGVPCIVIQTGRTEAQEVQEIATGHSWVHKASSSKHTPQPPEGKAEAIDICPRELIATPNWVPQSPLWWKIGVIGKSLGLVWGGDWTHINNGMGDRPHFEWNKQEETHGQLA